MGRNDSLVGNEEMNDMDWYDYWMESVVRRTLQIMESES